jgi:hypothetical protein
MRMVLCVAIVLTAGCARAPKATLVGYLGGSADDDCDGVASDSTGNVYLACHSNSADFPGLNPSHSPARASMQAVVAKIDSNTGRLLWATRTSGTIFDAAIRIRVGRNGTLYALGITRSPDFTTTDDALQRKFSGGENDIFLMKLDTHGNVVYSTLLGGSGDDQGTSFVVTDNGTVYIGGMTTSPDFPGARAARYGPGGKQDGFITKFRPGTPSSLQSLLIGGQANDRVSDLDFDPSGDLVLGGSTGSTDFPVSKAFQPKLAGNDDGFVAKLNTSNWNISFATYFGGSQLDAIWGLRVDPKGQVVVSGATESRDLPASEHVSARESGNSNAFVATIRQDGTQPLWLTYYGGTGATYGGVMEMDDAGRVCP